MYVIHKYVYVVMTTTFIFQSFCNIHKTYANDVDTKILLILVVMNNTRLSIANICRELKVI